MTKPDLDTTLGPSNSLSDKLLDRCARTIGDGEVRQATRLILDWCGNALAAVEEPSARSIRAAIAASAGSGRCTALGAEDLPPGDAAFANGSLGTLLEMDDLHRASIMHAGDVVIPAALASAQHAGCSGRILAEAVVLGYEVALSLGRAAASGGYTAWYNSATCGVFGAAIAAAHAAGATHEAKLNALGQAGMQASGVWQCRLEPTDSKAVATAHAARAGVTSALLAQQGLRGARHILDGTLGFFSTYYPAVDLSCVQPDPEDDWLIHDVSFKPWPACRHVHAAVGLAIKLRSRVEVADIVRVHVETYSAALEFCDAPRPQTPHEARFSLQHCVAVALLNGSLRLEHTRAGMLEDEAVSRLRGCVDVAEAAEYTQRFPENTGAKIVVVDASGIVHTLASHHALGDPEDPLDEDALSEKFTSNLKDIGVDGSASVQLAETIKDLGDCETLEPFGAALRAVSIQIPFSRMQS